ncbi:alpha/beta hydrolase [Chloroflexia bacterium SDU3-3]|nr:alpha/beta hydrolase [Chloroflexia bacterium SDU3-3]
MRNTLLALVAVVVLAVAGFVAWAELPLGAQDVALAALRSDDRVVVSEGRWLAFQPAGGAGDTGLIFYPGARVDERAYAPVLRQIAAQGYLVVLVPMPLHLAIFDGDAADDVRVAYPDVRRWVLAGHSMGGAMAASYAHARPDALAGIALWAAYPQASDSLADRTGLRALAVFGELHGLVSPDERAQAQERMPPDMRTLVIAGGNHAQFGSYGAQPGDAPAAIDAAAQQAQVVSATLDLLWDVAAAP